MSPLPVAFHEFVIAPLALGLAFLHARRALGPRRAIGELLALALYGYALEWVAIRFFSSHVYGEEWRLAPLGVPVGVAAVWAAVISSAMALAARLGSSSAWSRAVAAALLGVTLDLMMEPVAVRVGLWRWTPPGPWLGVPFGNFVGWAVVIGSYTVGAERWAGDGDLRSEGARRLALGSASVLALVLVGKAWTFVQAERFFTGRKGWAAWAAVLLVTASMRLWRGWSEGSEVRTPSKAPTLASRLGSAGGALPAAVFMSVATAFAADAAAFGDTAVGIAALGPVVILLVTLRP